MQAQQTTAPNTSSTDTFTLSTSTGLTTSEVTTEIAFEELTGGPRARVIAQLSFEIAGEIQRCERYVDAQAATLGLDSERSPLCECSYTPSAYGYNDRLIEALEKLDSGRSPVRELNRPASDGQLKQARQESLAQAA